MVACSLTSVMFYRTPTFIGGAADSRGTCAVTLKTIYNHYAKIFHLNITDFGLPIEVFFIMSGGCLTFNHLRDVLRRHQWRGPPSFDRIVRQSLRIINMYMDSQLAGEPNREKIVKDYGLDMLVFNGRDARRIFCRGIAGHPGYHVDEPMPMGVQFLGSGATVMKKAYNEMFEEGFALPQTEIGALAFMRLMIGKACVEDCLSGGDIHCALINTNGDVEKHSFAQDDWEYDYCLAPYKPIIPTF